MSGCLRTVFPHNTARSLAHPHKALPFLEVKRSDCTMKWWECSKSLVSDRGVSSNESRPLITLRRGATRFH